MMTTPIDNNIHKNMALSDKDVLMTGISKSAVRWVVASLSLILFTTIICLSYSIGVNDAEQGAIPIIRADGTAVKIRPNNPGGRQYPHQDLTIYNSFRDDVSEKNNQLRDNLEKPMSSMPTQVSDNATQENNVQNDTAIAHDDVPLETVTVSQRPTEKSLEKPLEKPLAELKLNSKEDSEAKINNIVAVNTNPVTQPVPQAQIQKPVTQPPLQATSGNNHFLQIGAYRSEADAVAGFNRAKSKLSSLAGANYNIAKADLGAKGVYYRLRVGPFASKEQSSAFCAKLQAQGQPCLYISQ